MTIAEAVQQAAQQLELTSTSARLDAEVLAAFVLINDRSFVLVHGTDEIDEEKRREFEVIIAQRAEGIPVAYLTGVKEFYGREFVVDERVLVPRPETEMIVDEAFRILEGVKEPRIADIGTGSGALAITLDLEIPNATVVATDISKPALDVVAQNAHTLDAHISLREGDVFEALTEEEHGSFDLIVSNPPYVDLKTVHLSNPHSASLKYEPSGALEPVVGDAFSIIEKLITEASTWLKPNGALLVEIGYNQGGATIEVAKKYFPQKNIEVKQDLTGIDRLLIIS